MFRCNACGSTEFQFMLQPAQSAAVSVSVNDRHEVMVRVGEQEFTADLAFMNRFALCRDCGALRAWEYYFP